MKKPKILQPTPTPKYPYAAGSLSPRYVAHIMNTKPTTTQPMGKRSYNLVGNHMHHDLEFGIWKYAP